MRVDLGHGLGIPGRPLLHANACSRWEIIRPVDRAELTMVMDNFVDVLSGFDKPA